ncbi:hypothetical protein B0H66DRAFT_605003 [Apodospora peruviana]|uniref:Distal membrane-arm assembly complex protein 1-like domain-containing protein n=1 Tax=Apodospora peruviana TaxID=516989 RepID=A0AAE0M2U5_9PEZI|nr:hypothetical protein B0H66DRAFT_605003 [Apodospora peruviana]
MAGDKVPSPEILDKPHDLKELLKQDRGDDCLSCKLVGSGAFFGLAAYNYWSGHQQLTQQKAKILASNSRFGIRSRRLGVTGISLALGWLGAWRLMK